MPDSRRALNPTTAIGPTLRPLFDALDPLRIIRDAWWLAIVAIGVLQQAHAELHEHRELSPLVHVLRDASLAVPAAAVAILVASLIAAGRTVAAPRPRQPRAVDRVVWAAAAAVVFAILSVPGNELHATLFGAEDEADLSWLADVALDAGIALIGALLALVPLAMVSSLPFRSPDPTSPSIDRPGAVLETSARSSQ